MEAAIDFTPLFGINCRIKITDQSIRIVQFNQVHIARKEILTMATAPKKVTKKPAAKTTTKSPKKAPRTASATKKPAKKTAAKKTAARK